MIGEILEAISKELQELFVESEPMIVRDTQFKPDDAPLTNAPLIIYSIGNSPDESILIGGATRADWDFSISVYILDVNANLDEDFGYSTDAYNLIDDIRKHFANQVWLTDEYEDIVKNYNFNLTLNGINNASAIQNSKGGVLVGYTINYNSVGLDLSTTFMENKTFTDPPTIEITIEE